MFGRDREMKNLQKLLGVVAVTAGVGWFVQAGAVSLSDYTIEQLLSPCFESDNDARWGTAAEAECEQYLRGFTDAYLLTRNNQEICLPEQNRDDEVRWAFMKWAKQNFGERRRPAAEGVLATLKQAFPCK